MAPDTEVRERAAEPLVETKLMAPRAPADSLLRGRLFDVLDRSAHDALVLVSAPVGFGKSILVQSWCAARSEIGVAWVSLDAGDNDPKRLWTYIVTAVDRVRPGLGRAAMKRLRASPDSMASVIDELSNALTTVDGRVVIVLDDLHLVDDPTAIDSIEYAVEHMPAQAQIVVTTRFDPEFNLAKLRARGLLGEIRAGELAYTADEAHELLVERARLALSDGEIELLLERTEGWPAGVYLAALWLRGVADPSAHVREFAGSHRHVADYLTREVLDALAADRRAFLLETSVLHRFTASLCDDVLERSDSASMLSSIASSNAFLISLDPRGEWYRYHHLFADLLQLQLAEVDPAIAPLLRRRAASWFAERRLTADAVEHALAAGDEQTVARLLDEHGGAHLTSGQEATLLRWTQALSDESLQQYPEVIVNAGLAVGLLRRRSVERKRYLELANRVRAEHPERWTASANASYCIARAAWIDGDVGETVMAARRAIEACRGLRAELLSIACLAYALLLAGDQAGAREQAERAIQMPEAPERPQGIVLALATLALVQVSENARSAEALAREALEIADAAGTAEGWIGGLARVALAAALTNAGKLPNAEPNAVRGEALRRSADPTVENTQALLVLVGARIARGRLPQAREGLAEAERMLAGFTDPGCLPDQAARLREALNRAEATRDAAALDDPLSPSELAVLELLSSELSQREIGATLFISLNTVKTHTREIYRKLGAPSRADAVARGAALGLIEPEAPSRAPSSMG